MWGVGEGPYLVAPFFGPQPPRDAVGLAVDAAIDPPWNYVPFKQHIWWDAGRYYFTLLDLRGQTYSTVQGVQRGSVDYYASLRSLYRQLRNNEIRNGRPGHAGFTGLLTVHRHELATRRRDHRGGQEERRAMPETTEHQ